MKKSEFKKLVKECQREIVFEEQFLSNIVEQSVQGAAKALLTEQGNQPTSQNRYDKVQNESRLQEMRREMRESASSSYSNASFAPPPPSKQKEGPKSFSSVLEQNGANLNDPGISADLINAIMNKQLH